MKRKTYSIKFDGGPLDGKVVEGLINPILIPQYTRTDKKDGDCIVFSYDVKTQALLPRQT